MIKSMHLVNIKFRCVYVPCMGWRVEFEKEKDYFFFTKKYWVHAVGYLGNEDRPFYYSSQESAIENAKMLFGWDLKAYGTGGIEEGR